MIPIIKAKAPSPGTLKMGLIYLFSSFPIYSIILECINNSVATKNGKSEGITELAQRASPDFTAGRLLLEKSKGIM